MDCAIIASCPTSCLTQALTQARFGSRRGGVISSLLLAGFVVILLLVCAGVIVTRTVHVKSTDGANGTDVAIETPAGRLNIRTRNHMDPSLAGVPVYPGARRMNDSGGANIEWNPADGGPEKGLYAVAGEFRTGDPASRVVEYYRNQLHTLTIVSERDRTTRLEYKEGGIQRIISIREKNGETNIGIASIGGRESN